MSSGSFRALPVATAIVVAVLATIQLHPSANAAASTVKRPIAVRALAAPVRRTAAASRGAFALLPGGSDVLAINAGGGAAAPFVADEDETTAGTWTYATSAAVSTAAVADPAPQAVYQSQRTGATTYTISGLNPGTVYLVRLHFAELYFAAAGQRVFNITLNGATVITNLDVFAAAGGQNIALVANLSATATAAGQVSVGFVAVTNNPIVNGIDIQTFGTGPTPTPTAAAPSTQDNITYHNNNLRTGWYSAETTLTSANVASSAFHLIGTMATAGKSYSQPLYLSAQTLSDGSTHNVLIVTDSTDVVYAYDADSLSLLWRHDFKGNGVRQQYASDIGCDDTWPNIGINGTPVIDRSRNELYVIVPTNDNGVPHLRLHGLSLGNGADAANPVDVSESVPLVSGGTAAVSAAYNFNRAGLLETNGTLYVSLSTHCDYDSGDAHGWLLAFSPATLALLGGPPTTDANVGNAAGVTFLGSIWQGGFGIAADAQSNLYFATGNGPNNVAANDYAMSVVRSPANLDFYTRQFFTPSTWLTDSQNDNDLGSGGVMLLPDQTSGPYAHLAIAGGKTGMKYLLNRDNLGGLQATDQVLWEAVTDSGIWGGPAYFVDSSGRQKILYGGTPSLSAYTLTTSPYGLTRTSATNVGPLEHRNAGVTPIVSSNGTQAGTAVVWATEVANAPNATAPVTLFAFNADNLGQTLFAGSAGQWSQNGDTGGMLVTPLVANGRVYLATDGEVTVFGLR